MVCEKGQERYAEIEVSGDPLDTYVEELRAFLTSVKEAQPPQVDVQHGIAVLEVAAAIDRSMRTGSAEQVGGA